MGTLMEDANKANPIRGLETYKSTGYALCPHSFIRTRSLTSFVRIADIYEFYIDSVNSLPYIRNRYDSDELYRVPSSRMATLHTLVPKQSWSPIQDNPKLAAFIASLPNG